ncbi:hypothetical protein C3F09_10005 [candidate division GN15 bacterium]|uniref:DUF2480 family protein n=1 Tax=candidate division GN15 bacterium TaxID=2072418 RepID=A0A855X1L2_9BACT|nr:MAG: hypothetical protein C3F09_10005 [candidate division GN15 bacterium]
MVFQILDPEEFLSGGILIEDEFLQKARQYDWEKFRNSPVLVRGCQSTVIPPWVYMYLTGCLAGTARSVRFGNEHDNIVVYRSPERREKSEQTGR